MTIKIGLWIIPLMITIVSIAIAWFKTPEPKHGHYFPDMTPVFTFGLNIIYALAVSLVAWIIYAIFLLA